MNIDDFSFLPDSYFDMRSSDRQNIEFIRHFVQCGLDRGIDSDCILSFLVGVGWNILFILECLGDFDG